LHSDLTAFCEKLHTRYPDAKLSTTTNGFWISEKNLLKHKKLFMTLSRFIVSIYPRFSSAIEQAMPLGNLRERISSLYPHLDVQIRSSKASQFMHAHYGPFPRDMAHAFPQCKEHTCAALLPDGRLTRCSTAAYGPLFNERLRAMAQCTGSYFNVYEWPEDLAQWLARIPFDGCAHCPFFRPELGPWRPDPDVPFRKAWQDEALARIEAMP
jgi:hypothetical protein